MASSQDFAPDWTSAPGETIRDVLVDREMSEECFAEEIGYSVAAIRDVLQGKATITLALARDLQSLLGASVEYWMARDFQYREDVARKDTIGNDWLSEIPVGDMIKFGWITDVPHPSKEIAACLEFFNVSSIDNWKSKYLQTPELAAFRTSKSFDSSPGAVAAWLRRGEIEADLIECKQWSAKGFEKSLTEIRRLTRQKSPARFIPELTRICSENGVAVVIVRAPTGCRASGAAHFLSQKKALIQLSFRYLTDDHFWFTFMHEAGHLILHPNMPMFIEGVDLPSSPEEIEANDFAAHELVPEEFQSELMSLGANSKKVIRFARRIGVSPGVVVGQLQHHGVVAHNRLNRLKRRFAWQE